MKSTWGSREGSGTGGGQAGRDGRGLRRFKHQLRRHMNLGFTTPHVKVSRQNICVKDKVLTKLHLTVLSELP